MCISEPISPLIQIVRPTSSKVQITQNIIEAPQGSEGPTCPWRDATGVPPFVEVLCGIHSLVICFIFQSQNYTKNLVISRFALNRYYL